MLKVNLEKATASNWQSLVKEAIDDAKSKCGNKKNGMAKKN